MSFGVPLDASPETASLLEPGTRAFYCQAMTALGAAGIPFMVGGAYAFGRYTGIERHTKDFDLFVHQRDFRHALDVLERAGYRAEATFPHWIGKVYCGDDFVDVIFGAGNGVALVDDEWLHRAVDDVVLGLPVRLCPPEEIIWSKAFIQERERFDGADVLHLLRACADRLDWRRLLRRFGPYWRVLYAHLVLFGFVYPGERQRIPAAIMRRLAARLDRELDEALAERVCQGTLLSRQQYLVDVNQWGYEDLRLRPEVQMTEDDIERWTAGIAVDGA